MNKLDSIKRKIKYRAGYRGIKEMDLLLTAFVEKYIDVLNYNELLDLQSILEEEDDAIRYGGLLEAEDYPPMSVISIEEELAIQTCEVYNYRYVVITKDDFVIPPRENDIIQTDKMA